MPCPASLPPLQATGTRNGERRLEVLAWGVSKGAPSSAGTITFDGATRTVTVLPPGGVWHRIAQVQRVVAPAAFRKALGTPAPPPPPEGGFWG